MSEEIRTERLKLVPTRAEHGPLLWEATEASHEELKRWMVWAVGARREDSEYYASEAERADPSAGVHHFTIFYGDVVAGAISLLRGEPRLGYVEVGYWLRSDLAGRGFMTEALIAVSRFAFERAGLHRVELRAAVDNAASRRVAEKAGYSPRGVLRESVYGDGRYVDAVIYDLLADDPVPEA